jgi:GT2 family glycosyltransferase
MEVPDVLVTVNQTNIGFGRAHNAILEHAGFFASKPQPPTFDAYLALNPDVVLMPDYIAEIAAHIGEAGWATGKLLKKSNPSHIYSMGHALFRSGYAINIGYGLPDVIGRDSKPIEVFGAPGAAVFYRVEFLVSQSTQGFFYDPHMFLYGEDTDIDWRGKRAGWRCYCVPSAIAYHRGSSPHNTLKDEALINRYASVLKNAYLIDLAAINVPLILAHLVFRIITTPGRGYKIARRLLNQVPSFLRQRKRPVLSRESMNIWFRWAAQQHTGQPTTIIQRLDHFWRGYVK